MNPDMEQDSGIGAILRRRMASGPLSAAEVMALALYHPEHGYYRRQEGPWGFEGKDYYTALDTGPLLGEALAARLESAWNVLGRPPLFTVLEPGAGRGWLGRDLLAAASGPFSKALVYVHRDDNPAARAAAASALAPFLADGRARFVSEQEPLPVFQGAVISNELFDALPAQPWRWDGSRWLRAVLTATGPAWAPGDAGEAGIWFQTQAEGGAASRGRGRLVRRHAGPRAGAGTGPGRRALPRRRLRRPGGPAGGQGGESPALPIPHRGRRLVGGPGRL